MNVLLRLLVTSVICLAAVSSVATVLPESTDLRPAAPIVRPIDDGLEQWLAGHAEQKPPSELSEKELNEALPKLDDVTRTLIELRLANSNNKPNQQALAFTREMFRDEKQLARIANHALLPYLLDEFLNTTGVTDEERLWTAKLLYKNGGRSCPKKSLILKELSSTSGDNLSENDFDQLLARITSFRSKQFRKEALGSFLDTLPQKHQEVFRKKLLNVVVPFPKILEDNAWLVNEDDESTRTGTEPFKSLREAEKEAGRHHCRTAKLALLRAANFDKDKVAFAKVEQVADKIEGCFRRKGSAAREKFWVQVRRGLSNVYDFKGKELALRKVGLLAWSRDEFTRARKIFADLIEEAKQKKETKLVGESLFTLARIEENDNKISKSLDFYQQFVTQFPESERYLEALEAMVLLHSINGNFPASLRSAETIIRSQSKRNIDDQDTSALSFALFWAGRLNYTLGNKKLAQEMWRRVASEYYSTFYGALGHFVLEKLQGKHLELEPNVGQSVAVSKYLDYYNEEDRTIFQTASALLKVGMRTEASCELAEVVVDDNGKEKILVKALFQHAAGEWLSSIINYSGLPRSFRHSLPIGFERILFPRAFVSEVSNYTEKVNVDPDLVFAIIRQESVFNPRAHSGAGARGLMQLMPGTARLESRRLGRSYLPRSERNRLQQSAKSTDKLFDADTNLALGVHHVHSLLEKYGNPIYLLTSYNANPRATERWIQNIPTEDYLAFIERIPYRETQAYVKLVMRNYFYYKRWYRAPTSKLPHLDQMAQNMMKIATVKQRETRAAR